MQGMKSGLLAAYCLRWRWPVIHWNVTLPGGSMRFQGLIMASSCRVEAGDRQMTVNLGQISSNRFHAVGEDSNPIPFAIHLQDCSTAVSQHVGVTFHGVADGKNPDVLSVGEGRGSPVDRYYAIRQPGPAAPAQSSSGSLDITLPRTDDAKFVAKYRATGRQVTGGAANAQAWFSLTYQ
ncbi:type 1 pilus biosynthesis fimbrial protein [Klebsiella pneumoniae]|uniref:Type 1 pilus biosynthesis fimbrial protein n=1 Tax=Klebsiella pneumoniae TaxID=573 RepID=A0A378A8K4_KLEPN|nr:type 1 pilus biosynthesis fimbrial protein [Klebsiella pneumoniae]